MSLTEPIAFFYSGQAVAVCLSSVLNTSLCGCLKLIRNVGHLFFSKKSENERRMTGTETDGMGRRKDE